MVPIIMPYVFDALGVFYLLPEFKLQNSKKIFPQKGFTFSEMNQLLHFFVATAADDLKKTPRK